MDKVNFPVFKKLPSNKEVFKIVSENEMVSIQSKKYWTNTRHTTNTMDIELILSSEHVKDATAEDFEKSYVEAINKLSRVNSAR